MKTLLFSVCLITLPLLSRAQCYQSYKQEGDRLNRKAIYEKAIKQYLAAFTCPGLAEQERNGLIRLIDGALQARVRQLEAANEKTQQALERTTAAEQEAKQSLADLQGALQNIFNNYLQLAEEDILNLDYEGALSKIQDAVQLKVDDEQAGLAMIELVYFFNESGRYERAISLSDTLRVLLDLKSLAIQQDSLADIRAYLSEANLTRYQQLEARYYPVMVDIPGGTFEMGCNGEIDGDCRGGETPHQVQLRTYRLAKYETTNWQYNLYCISTGQDSIDRTREGWPLQGNLPVVNVSWYDAIQYLNWLNHKKGITNAYDINKEKQDSNNTNVLDALKWTVQLATNGQGYRLPTEAEWEYAAQGAVSKKATVYSGSDQLAEVGWFGSNSNSRPQPVGILQANSLGLYDLSGNVWEWCWDWYGAYVEGSVEDPQGPDSGGSRVLRGGSWLNVDNYCRVSDRNNNYPYNRYYVNGFRVAQGL